MRDLIVLRRQADSSPVFVDAFVATQEMDSQGEVCLLVFVHLCCVEMLFLSVGTQDLSLMSKHPALIHSV